VEFRVQAPRRLRVTFTRDEEAIFKALAQDLGKPRFEVLASEITGVRKELDVAIWRKTRSARDLRASRETFSRLRGEQVAKSFPNPTRKYSPDAGKRGLPRQLLRLFN
jgi:hypothetical protein